MKGLSCLILINGAQLFCMGQPNILYSLLEATEKPFDPRIMNGYKQELSMPPSESYETKQAVSELPLPFPLMAIRDQEVPRSVGAPARPKRAAVLKAPRTWKQTASPYAAPEIKAPAEEKKDEPVVVREPKKRFACLYPRCKKAFAQNGGLTNHNRIHTGAKPFVCEECERGFSQKCNLTRHIRIHIGEKPYECESCPRRFNSSWGRTVHMRSHKKNGD